MFSQESSQALFEMGNVELIELNTSLIQCPSCLHHVFKGTLLCQCGKHIRPDLNMMRRIKAAFRNSESTMLPYVGDYCKGSANTALIRGKNITTKEKTHYGVFQKAKETLRRSGTDGKNDETHRKSQLVHDWSDAWVNRNTSHVRIRSMSSCVRLHHKYNKLNVFFNGIKELCTALVDNA